MDIAQVVENDKLCKERVNPIGVVTFTKKRDLIPSSPVFTKNIYLGRNGESIEETICYNTNLYIKNDKERRKLLKLTSNENKSDNDKDESSSNKEKYTDIVKTHLCSSISVKRSSTLNPDDFTIQNISFTVYNITNDKFEAKHSKSFSLKASLLRTQNERNIGNVTVEFKSQNNHNRKFVVVIEVIQKTKTSCTKSIKKRLVDCLCESSVAIQKSFSRIPPKCTTSERHVRKTSMEYLMSLNLFNWKMFGFEFVTPKHESCYKQIRRRNKSLPNI